jgi:hypothetical protein
VWVWSAASHLKAVRSTPVHNTVLALHTIRRAIALFTQSGKRTYLSRTHSTLPYYVTSRFDSIFSSTTAVRLPNSHTHSEQNSVCVPYSYHARYVSRQSHPPSKNKARCTDKFNRAPATPHTARRSQWTRRWCRSLWDKLSCSALHNSDCHIYIEIHTGARS